MHNQVLYNSAYHIMYYKHRSNIHYSPNLSPCSYNKTPKLKKSSHIKKFVQDILEAVWCEAAQISMSGDASGVCHLAQ